MNKNAQAVIDNAALEDNSASDKSNKSDKEKLYLKLKKEAEIRMKLDEFAREMALAKAERASRWH